MALPDLATSADLSDRGVDATVSTDTMLAVASSLVRQAAQSPILETTSTVTLWAVDQEQWLALPGKPITDVTSVTVDGTLFEDYKLVYDRLWRLGGWRNTCEPVQVDVVLTHGFAAVPEHIKQLVCDLAILGMTTATTGGHDPNVVAEKIDDYSVTFAQGYESVASAMELPRATKQAIRKQFGGGAAMVTAS